VNAFDAPPVACRSPCPKLVLCDLENSAHQAGDSEKYQADFTSDDGRVSDPFG